ncbi:caffeine-induced death protein 2 [Yarrowia lipolytica]|uniref:Caffeine-induced death protein 2 n=1 Tax=Yarrowia lipolytica TaxID=4952 RepID=A0A371C1T0_YARLL|nr:caffeine-induced death protein 2 [Yarrowia lipolytica]RDW32282.1 caffeine-induced death protein 2 [Yarrowia lipolytica]RDW39070.1 caffeine-induced death protein 2 [Yarrowia lipolytica]RDW48189.1 caffeine-induced death protein 2 [Yarrowia lipolytica]RDW54980.1 caffeine-induced death protein 2 [Yarrowia lipolytica]
MSSWTPPKPGLTAANCIEARALRQFLRASRKTVDDRVLVTISKLGNDTAAEQIKHNSGYTGYKPACNEFVQEVLLPAWNERDRVLTYCGDVARLAKDKKGGDMTEAAQTQDENEKPAKRQPLDPYAAEARTNQKSDADRVLDWIETERTIEGIVRDTTRAEVYDKCGISLQ